MKVVDMATILKFCAMELTICIRFVTNVTPKEVYASVSFGHDPVKTVAMPTIFVSVFRFLDLVSCHRLGF